MKTELYLTQGGRTRELCDKLADCGYMVKSILLFIFSQNEDLRFASRIISPSLSMLQVVLPDFFRGESRVKI